MVQFNLLPDVKVDYVKTQKSKRLVMLAAFAAIALSIFVVVLLLLIVNVFQKQHIGNLNDDIKTKTDQLKSIQDLDKVLTVQNQLNDLTPLHETKPASSRLYSYLIQMTPTSVKISDVALDFDANTLTITGTADRLQSINQYADTIKFSKYIDGETTNNAFKEVVLSSFAVTEGQAAGRTSYSLTFKFDPILFNNTKDIKLSVPNIVSTRSVQETPTDLFEASQSNQNAGGQQ